MSETGDAEQRARALSEALTLDGDGALTQRLSAVLIDQRWTPVAGRQGAGR